MPRFLERKLQAEYPGNPRAVYGTLNSIGAMRGNKETPKGAAMERKHDAKVSMRAAVQSHPAASRLGKFLHPKKIR
jgi:hypothetical protein